MQKKEKILQYIINILMIFIILQPIFDVFSNLANNNIIKLNLITYIKPCFVFLIYLFIFFFYKFKGKYKQIFFYLLIFFYLIAHSLMLYAILVDFNVIFHEIRFLINIIYFITIFLTLYNISTIVKDKDKFYNQLKYTLIITFSLYIILYLLAVITGTSWLTYEFADENKLGFRGWNFSGQILGHTLSISLPIVIYAIFKLKVNNIIKFIIIALYCIPFFIIGTKVPFFILLLVSIINILLNIGYKFFHHEYKINKFVCFTSLIIIIVGVALYKNLPVYSNILLNNIASNEEVKKEDLTKYTTEMRKKAQKNKETIEKNKNSKDPIVKAENKLDFIISDKQREKLALQYEDWTLKGLDKLNQMYDSNSLHSADTRNRQMYFLHFKFMLASLPFKLLGLGYLNQPDGLSIERDIIMPFYAFGICGFIVFTGILWYLLLKMIYKFFKCFKSFDLETILLCESFCMFFFISFYAGYTYIYTQFSIVLAIIMTLLNLKLNTLNNKKKDNLKVLFISSTGGHLNELLQLKPMFKKYDYH